MSKDTLWTVTDLAAFLGYRVPTIITMVSRTPEKLPPRIAALAKPRWYEAAVHEWAAQQSRPPPTRSGRTRVN